ncbi:hypothetical protein QQ008_05085 [Fulvivirgaceae bacterium BMA10]|uniref:Outer membrane protein beta-barrel domain-containing protein n=1 Tax=Splendidivirga corallicola TaxID=3051826 RepID=A0ABT8KLX0_9BACT|nr:hypothetical protein [Fulvivirgaceae bacterium BMA10]
MKSVKYLSALCVVLLLANVCQAQMRTNGKKLKKFACPIIDGSKGQNLGIGGKLGDPYGLTMKLYLPKKFAFELVAGKTFGSLYNQANQRIFEDNPPVDAEVVTYLSHNTNKSMAFQARLAYHYSVPGYSNLDWYMAAGFQYRYFQIEYIYQFENSNPVQIDIGSVISDLNGYGPEAAIGIEFLIPTMPLTSFAEVGFFADINNQGAPLKFFGGLGLRYNFFL